MALKSLQQTWLQKLSADPLPSTMVTVLRAGSGPLQKRQNQGVSLANVMGGFLETTLKEKALCHPCQPLGWFLRRRGFDRPRLGLGELLSYVRECSLDAH